jgi:phosphatidylserine/phosphatidylglycerophosphate/cardiolipin synthase-like enzyme
MELQGMEGYLIWLAYLVLAIIAFSALQLQVGRNRRLQKDCRQMQIDVKRLQLELRMREKNIDHLQRDQSQLLKWKDRASELEKELRTTKQKQDYASAQRLQYLEDYLASAGENPSALFLGTFPPRNLHTFEDHLRRMLEGAEFEVVIISPWIKRRVWDRIKGPLQRFARRGGRLKVFMRGSESDYNIGLSDDIRADVLALGGEVVSVRQLHAKIYLVDEKEAIVASSNLTKGGMEENYEAGIWLRDPAVLKKLCAFVDDLYHCRQS